MTIKTRNLLSDIGKSLAFQVCVFSLGYLSTALIDVVNEMYY